MYEWKTTSGPLEFNRLLYHVVEDEKEYIFNEIVIVIALMVINSFYMKVFGNFFDKLLDKGVVFSWTLFLFATVIILIFAIVVFGFSPKKTTKKVGKNIIRAVRKHREHRTQQVDERFVREDQADIDEMRRIRDSL